MSSLSLRRDLASLWNEPSPDAARPAETTMELRKNGHRVVGFRRSHALDTPGLERAPKHELFEASVQGLLSTLERTPVWTQEREAGPSSRDLRVRLAEAPGGFGTLIARFHVHGQTLTQSVVYLADDADAEEEADSFLDAYPTTAVLPTPPI